MNFEHRRPRQMEPLQKKQKARKTRQLDPRGDINQSVLNVVGTSYLDRHKYYLSEGEKNDLQTVT